MTNIIQGDIFSEEHLLSYFLDQGGLGSELIRNFEKNLRMLYPQLSNEKFMIFHFQFSSQLTKKIDELLTGAISYPSNNYYRKGMKVKDRVEEYARVLRKNIYAEIGVPVGDRSIPMRLSALISDSSIKLKPEYNYQLAHRGQNPTDHIEFVIFSSKVTNKLNKDATLRMKMLKACRRGVVTHAHNSNGIKRIRQTLFEIKDVSIDKRLWGCLEDGVLIIHGITDHKGISHIDC